MMVFIKAYSNRSGNVLSVAKAHCPLIKAYFDNRRNQKCRKYSTNTQTLPKSFKVAICGGGAMGASVAYHLAQLGWGPQTIVIEQDLLGTGKKLFSSDLIGVFKPTLSQVKLCQSSVKMYQELQSQGYETGWKQCGSLCVARTRDRMTVFKRMKSQSVSWGINCEIVDPQKAKEICPYIRIDDIKGALWIPEDGIADSYKIGLSFLNAAKKKGVFVVDGKLLDVVCDSGKVVAIDTSKGSFECDYFINCAGFWARQIGQLSNPTVKIPLHPVEHYYLLTNPIPNIDSLLTPVVRDQDGHIYLRESNGCILAGGFEPNAKPAFENMHYPDAPAGRQLLADWDHFHILFEQILHRVPALENVTLDKLVNYAETFSPDCKWIVGQAPEIKNYYVAAGMKTVGISAAGGVGQAIAETIVNGYSQYDLYELDMSRFLGLHNNKKFLRDRVKEIPGRHYSLQYPNKEFITGRNLRMSPIYPKLKEAGAVFEQVMGYERPSWFDPDLAKARLCGDTSSNKFVMAKTNTFGKPDWFDIVEAEYEACRENVSLLDYSSFTKLDIQSKGREVLDSLQYLCSNDVDVPIGSIIHTGMQNVRGGYENDCSLIRLEENHFMMIAPTIQQTRCKIWIQRQLPSDNSVSLTDVTSMFTAICIMGPFTRHLLSELTDTDLSPKSFPFFTYKELDVGLANGIRALNLTHTGELGYVLYIPNEFSLHVYNSLIEAGKKYNLKHAGCYAMKALRVEKFYAFWGQDLDTSTTPLECGRSWRVKFDKGINFIGRDALLRQREEGIKRIYVQLLLNDHDPDTELWSWGGEPIFRDKKYVGATTTTSYGFTFKKQVCLGFVQNLDKNGLALPVTNEYVMSGEYEVEIAGIRYPAKVNINSPNLPTKYPDKERESYLATRDNMISEPLLRNN